MVKITFFKPLKLSLEKSSNFARVFHKKVVFKDISKLNDVKKNMLCVKNFEEKSKNVFLSKKLYSNLPHGKFF